jgi:dUTP pyrophosphatase
VNFYKENKADAGYDLVAQQGGTVRHGEVTLFDTGVTGNVPPGTVGLVFARSGLGVKHGVRPSNAVGVVDPFYEGVIKVGLTRDIAEGEYVVEKGDRIAQIVFIPLSAYTPGLTSDRGDKGFGSSGVA